MVLVLQSIMVSWSRIIFSYKLVTNSCYILKHVNAAVQCAHYTVPRQQKSKPSVVLLMTVKNDLKYPSNLAYSCSS